MQTIVLQQDIDRLKLLMDTYLQSYVPAKKTSVEELILSALLKYANSAEKKSLGESRQDVLLRIRKSMSLNEPVPVSLTIAFGMRAPSPLKYRDPYGLPTYAWLHMLAALMLIDRRVQLFYSPGVKFFVFEEGLLFRDLLEIPFNIVERNLRVFDVLKLRLGASVTNINLLPEHLPMSEALKIEVPVSESEVLAFVCSASWMADPAIVDYLYASGEKPFEKIRDAIGMAKWNQVRELAVLKNKTLALRKKIGLFPRLVNELTKEDVSERMIDATITFKEKRVVIKPTDGALFNHGMTIIHWPRFNCYVVPEYRIDSQFVIGDKVFKLEEVRIDPSEFGLEGSPFTWRYETM